MCVPLVGVTAHQAGLPAGDQCMSEFKLTPEVVAEVCDVLLTRVPRRKLGNPGRSCLARVSRRKLDNPGDQDGERRTNELPLQGPATLTGRKSSMERPLH